MLRSLAITFLLMSVFFCASSVAEEDTSVSKETVTLYSEENALVPIYATPDRDAPIIAHYYPTVQAQILSVSADQQGTAWYLLDIHGFHGYVPHEMINPKSEYSYSETLYAYANRDDFRNPLTAYQEPSVLAKPVSFICNGQFLNVLGYLPDGWVHLNIDEWQHLERTRGYAQIAVHELADTSVPDSTEARHPLYKEAYLDLDIGGRYIFHQNAPEAILQALQAGGLKDGFVVQGAISPFTSQFCTLVLSTADGYRLCLLHEEQGAWLLDTSVQLPDAYAEMIASSLYFPSSQNQFSLGYDWEGGPLRYTFHYDSQGNWVLERANVDNSPLGSAYYLGLRIEPLSDRFHITGEIRMKRSWDIFSIDKFVDHALPSLTLGEFDFEELSDLLMQSIAALLTEYNVKETI